MFFKLILVPKFSSIEFVHVVFIQDKDTFPRHIGLVVLISRSPQPQGAQALICISVVCFSVYLFYECLYIAF